MEFVQNRNKLIGNTKSIRSSECIWPVSSNTCAVLFVKKNSQRKASLCWNRWDMAPVGSILVPKIWTNGQGHSQVVQQPLHWNPIFTSLIQSSITTYRNQRLITSHTESTQSTRHNPYLLEIIQPIFQGRGEHLQGLHRGGKGIIILQSVPSP